MGGDAPDERQTRVGPRREPILEHRGQEMASLPIPDELLEEILHRLPTPADLVRAAAGCVSFRRVAADRFFLRRYRKLHTPPLVGFFERGKVFHPAFALNPSSTSAAGAVALAADFSFSFLPPPASAWVLRDIRDGRVLLERTMCVHNNSSVVFPEVVVCDPLHRRYLLLPPISSNLAASVEDPLLTKKKIPIRNFLVPTGDDGEEAATDETSFRVIWMAQCKTRLVAFVFSSNTGQWGAVPSPRWSDLSAGLPPLLTRLNLFYSRHFVHGCFYFGMTVTTDSEEDLLVVFDIKTMEFSITKSPPEVNSCCDFVMVEAGEGGPGMLVLEYSGSDLSYFIRQNDGGSSSQWQKVKTISLGSWAHLICNMEKYPLLFLGQVQSLLPEAVCFKLDMETFQLEKVCTLGSRFDGLLHAYSNFPPSLSSPTLSSGVENKAEKVMLEQGFAASSSAESPWPE